MKITDLLLKEKLKNILYCISGLLIPQYFYIPSGQTEMEKNRPGSAERLPSDAGTTNGIFMWGQAVYFISQLLGMCFSCCTYFVT